MKVNAIIMNMLLAIAVVVMMQFAFTEAKSKGKKNQQKCTVPGMEWNECASACPESCSKPAPEACIKMCVPACACPTGTILDDTIATPRCVEKCPTSN